MKFLNKPRKKDNEKDVPKVWEETQRKPDLDLIERLKREKPNRNVVFTAIEKLTEPEEIRKFYRQYVDYLRAEAKDIEVKNNPENVARCNINYIVGYYITQNDHEVEQRWMNALNENKIMEAVR